MPKQTNDHCVTVRLAPGVASELKAATGMPISTLLRTMAVQLLERERAKRQGLPIVSVHEALTHDINELAQEQEHG